MTAIHLAARTTPARVRLRPTMTSDLDFVISLEEDPANLAFITPWERTQHEAAVRFPDFRHFIVEGGDDYASVGFVILIGCKSRNRSLELKRMVIRSKGTGYGRAALREVKKIAFDDLHAHRLWLDVKSHNTRAKSLYDSEGFVVEGVLREAVLTDNGFCSMVVMSMLEPEFANRRALALEAA